MADLLKRASSNKKDSCWTIGNPNKKSYRSVGIGGRKTMLAHRFLAEIRFGPVPSNLDVCHHCDNPPCMNPYHLFVGTHADNIRDCLAKGRGKRLRGDDRPNAILSEKDVDQILTESKNRKWGWVTRTARRFGVTPAAISNIVGGRNWNWKLKTH